MQCPRHFLWGPSVTPYQRRLPRESGPLGTASLSFGYIELTWPPCVRLWGPWKTMFHMMPHKKEAQIGHVIFISLMFLARHF